MPTDYTNLIPRDVAADLIESIGGESVAMRLGRTITMQEGLASLPLVSAVPSADFVDLGERKPISKVEWSAARNLFRRSSRRPATSRRPSSPCWLPVVGVRPRRGVEGDRAALRRRRLVRRQPAADVPAERPCRDGSAGLRDDRDRSSQRGVRGGGSGRAHGRRDRELPGDRECAPHRVRGGRCAPLTGSRAHLLGRADRGSTQSAGRAIRNWRPPCSPSQAMFPSMCS